MEAPLMVRDAQYAAALGLSFSGDSRSEELAGDSKKRLPEDKVLRLSPVTVMRDWSTAKAWLYRELSAGD
jgi:hypothetical protein